MLFNCESEGGHIKGCSKYKIYLKCLFEDLLASYLSQAKMRIWLSFGQSIGHEQLAWTLIVKVVESLRFTGSLDWSIQ